MNTKAINDAFILGIEHGYRDTAPGATFQGAMPAAREAGYIDDTPEFTAYLAGFLSVIPATGIHTDGHGRVIGN